MRAHPAVDNRELVAEEDVTDPQELLDDLMARLGPDGGTPHTFNDPELEEDWIQPFPEGHRRLAREHYYRLAREFGLLNWERLPSAMRAIGVSTCWSGPHGPVSFNEGNYNLLVDH